MNEPQARHAIEQLIYRYAEALDSGDLDSIVALFEKARARIAAGDVVYEGGPAVRDMFVAFTAFYDADEQPADALAPGSKPYTKHLCSNLIIELADDGLSARCRSYFTVFQGMSDFPYQAIAGGRYHDQFVCDNGTWRFAERTYFMEHAGDLSRHMKQAVNMA